MRAFLPLAMILFCAGSFHVHAMEYIKSFFRKAPQQVTVDEIEELSKKLANGNTYENIITGLKAKGHFWSPETVRWALLHGARPFSTGGEWRAEIFIDEREIKEAIKDPLLRAIALHQEQEARELFDWLQKRELYLSNEAMGVVHDAYLLAVSQGNYEIATKIWDVFKQSFSDQLVEEAFTIASLTGQLEMAKHAAAFMNPHSPTLMKSVYQALEWAIGQAHPELVSFIMDYAFIHALPINPVPAYTQAQEILERVRERASSNFDFSLEGPFEQAIEIRQQIVDIIQPYYARPGYLGLLPAEIMEQITRFAASGAQG